MYTSIWKLGTSNTMNILIYMYHNYINYIPASSKKKDTFYAQNYRQFKKKNFTNITLVKPQGQFPQCICKNITWTKSL